MRLSKSSSSSRGEVDSGAQPQEDRQAYRQARQRQAQWSPHTCSGRVKSGRRVYQWSSVVDWAMPGRPGTMGQCRAQSESSRVKTNRVESERVKLCVVGTELNRKLCRGVAWWCGTTAASYGEVNWIEGRL